MSAVVKLHPNEPWSVRTISFELAVTRPPLWRQPCDGNGHRGAGTKANLDGLADQPPSRRYRRRLFGQHDREGRISLNGQMQGSNPHELVLYRYLPIEWAAPEPLVLTSLFHTGPRLSIDVYRVLDLGNGTWRRTTEPTGGANLVPSSAAGRPRALDGAGK